MYFVIYTRRPETVVCSSFVLRAGCEFPDACWKSTAAQRIRMGPVVNYTPQSQLVLAYKDSLHPFH